MHLLERCVFLKNEVTLSDLIESLYYHNLGTNECPKLETM